MPEDRLAVSASRVTVVVPTKDRAELLGQTLRSIREQSAPPAEVIVADDGSTDHTAEVLAAAGATRVYNPNGDWGASAARNAGLERVSTEFVAFLDSDDLLLPGALAALERALLASPAAPFAYGQGLAARLRAGGWEPEGLIRAERGEIEWPLCGIFARNCVPSAGALVRVAAVREVGGYAQDVVWTEDHHLWVRLVLLGPPAHVDELVCIHRRHPGNRHTPALAAADSEAILALAREDPRLQACLGDRLGVEICEVSLSLLKQRPWRVPFEARRLLRGLPNKRGIVRRAVAHWRDRRRWAHDGRRLWRHQDGLRRWLSTYGGIGSDSA
jgi:glycosyltransferase involved in cell wall biosynthesis